MIRSSVVWLVFGIAVPFAAGCTSEPRPVAVNGTVTLDAKPVSHGRIIFSADDGSPPVSLDVKDGKFEGKVKPGKKRVEIWAERKTGRKNAFYPDDEELENYIPVRYNQQTTLSEDIPQEGKSGLKFDLKSK